MRIGPFELSRKQAVTAAAAPAIKAPDELGASGVINLHGFLSELEYNQDLHGKEGLKVYDRMLRSDGSVAEAAGHITEPVKNATWTIDPASNEPEDLEVAEACRRAFFKWLNQPWLEVLDHVLEYPFKGHAVVELVWQVVEEELEYEIPDEYDVDPATGKRTPKTTTVPARQFLTFDMFAPRLQETIYRWGNNAGRLTWVQQYAWKNTGDMPIPSNAGDGYSNDPGYGKDDGTFGRWTIPAEQLLLFVHRKRGDDYTGVPIIRAAYKAWVMKELLEKIAVIAAERHGAGLVIGYLPEMMREDTAALQRLEDMLRDMRAGAYPYFAFPGPKASATRDGYQIEILSPAGTIPDFSQQLGYQRGEIKAAVLARFAELGHQSVGARATGDIQSIVWFAALHSVARYMADVFQQAIVRFVDANYPGVGDYPTMSVSNLEARNLQEYAQAQSLLVSSGAVNPDTSYRAAVRDEMDLPPEDDPGLEDQAADTGAPVKPTDMPAGPTDSQGRPIEADPTAPTKPAAR